MFTIRKKQFDALAAAQQDAYVARMVTNLAKGFPDEIAKLGLEGEELEAFVRAGIERAAGYAVVYEDDVQAFLGCLFEIGTRFDTDLKHKWAGDLLRREQLTGTLKMNKISEELTFRGTAG